METINKVKLKFTIGNKEYKSSAPTVLEALEGVKYPEALKGKIVFQALKGDHKMQRVMNYMQVRRLKVNNITKQIFSKNIELFLKGRKMSDEIKKKISLTLKGKIPKNINQIKSWNKGRKMSEEARKRISEANKGRKSLRLGTKVKYKARPSMVGRIPWNKGNRGKSEVNLKKNIAKIGRKF